MSVEGVDGGHVDEPRARVATDGDGHELATHLVGELVDQGGQRNDGREERDGTIGELLLERLVGQVPELQHGPHEWDLGCQLAEEASFDFRRVDGPSCDEATPELDGHRVTLSLAPLPPRDPKFYAAATSVRIPGRGLHDCVRASEARAVARDATAPEVAAPSLRPG
jgi:hypothetical protein